MEKETFWTLLFDLAHWEFEIFLMVLFDFVIGFVGWRYILRPLLNKWFKHHTEDHTKIDKVDALEERIKKLEDDRKREQLKQSPRLVGKFQEGE